MTTTTVTAPAVTVTVPGAALRAAVRAVALAAAGAKDAPVLRHVEMAATAGVLTLAATDRFRLHVADLPVTGDLPDAAQVPAADLVRVVKSWPRVVDTVTVHVTADAVRFDVPGASVSVPNNARFHSFPGWHGFMTSVPGDAPRVDTWTGNPAYLADAYAAAGFAALGKDVVPAVFTVPADSAKPALITAGDPATVRVRALVMPWRVRDAA